MYNHFFYSINHSFLPPSLPPSLLLSLCPSLPSSLPPSLPPPSSLAVECDEDEGLTFNYPASILLQDDQVRLYIIQRSGAGFYTVILGLTSLCNRFLQVQSSTTRSHHFTLLNPSSSTLQFSLSCQSQHFSLAIPELGDQRGVILKPWKSIAVCHHQLNCTINFAYCNNIWLLFGYYTLYFNERALV